MNISGPGGLHFACVDQHPRNRSRERYRRLALTAATAAVSRGASLLSGLASIPLTIRYLGTERFALWMTINSLMAMLMFADLGLGNGLMTALSECHGRDDMARARQYISTAFFMLLAIGACVFLMIAALYQHVPWARILAVRSGSAFAEAALAATVFFVIFACNLPLGIVQRIQSGFQRGYASNAWNGFGVLLGFAGVVACAYFKAGVPWLVLSVGAGPIVGTLLNGTQLFRSRPELRPHWMEFQWPILRQLLSVGFCFLILQGALAMAVGSDNFVIAHLFGPDAVTEYSIAMRIFTIVPGLASMVVMALWPAYGEAVARGDAAWAVRALGRSVIAVGAITSGAAVILIFSARWMIALWVGNQFHQGFWLLSGMGVWMVLNAVAVVVSIFLNGVNRVQVQVISAIAVAVSTLTIELLTAPRFGLAAMIWSTDISYLLFVWIPAALFLPRLLRNLKSKDELQRIALVPNAPSEISPAVVKNADSAAY